MNRVGQALMRKIGPLPAIAWGGVLAAVILVYRHFQSGSGSSSTTATASPVLPGGYDPSSVGPFAGAGGGGGDPLGPPTDQGTVDPNLTGPGTPIVYDPLSGTATDPTTATGGGATSPAAGTSSTDSSFVFPGVSNPTPTDRAIDTGRPARAAAGAAVFRRAKATAKAPARPTSTRGQTAGKKKRVRRSQPAHPAAHTAHAPEPKHQAAAAAAPVSHPVSARSEKAPAPIRQTAPPAAATRPRSEPSAPAGRKSAPAPNVHRPGMHQ